MTKEQALQTSEWQRYMRSSDPLRAHVVHRLFNLAQVTLPVSSLISAIRNLGAHEYMKKCQIPTDGVPYLHGRLSLDMETAMDGVKLGIITASLLGLNPIGLISLGVYFGVGLTSKTIDYLDTKLFNRNVVPKAIAAKYSSPEWTQYAV